MFTLDEYVKFLDRKIITRPSLALLLKDEFTVKEPIGKVRVLVNDQEVKFVKSPSGYRLFFKLSTGSYKIRVKSEHYLEEETDEMTLPFPDPMNPVKEISLRPGPSYPFPSGATLIRGMVEDLNGKGAWGAKVEVIGKEVSNGTTEKGEFVLYFKALTEDDDIITEDSRRFVKGTDSKIVSLKATSGSKTGTVDLEEVEEGKTTLLESPIIVN